MASKVDLMELEFYSKCNIVGPDGLSVAMPAICYTQLSAEERETLSLGLAHGYSLRVRSRWEVFGDLGY